MGGLALVAELQSSPIGSSATRRNTPQRSERWKCSCGDKRAPGFTRFSAVLAFTWSYSVFRGAVRDYVLSPDILCERIRRLGHLADQSSRRLSGAGKKAEVFPETQ
jgi:hypothetical protein